MTDVNFSYEANHTRLSRLLIAKGTEAFRKIFDTFYSSSTLLTFLKTHKALLSKLNFKAINENQWDLLFPKSSNPDSKHFDISLLTVLLRTICGLKFPLAKVWSTTPPDTDRSQKANIVRLRLFRNEICVHVANTEVTDDKFEDLWSKISQTFIELGVSTAEIEQLRDSPLGPDDKNYIEILKDWKIQEIEMQKILDEETISVKKVLKTTHEIKKSLSENTRKLQESIDKQTTEIEESIAEESKAMNELTKDKKQAESSSKQEKYLLLKLSKFKFNGDVEKLGLLFHPGTREWLFTLIENWFLTKGPNVFVLTAGPGVGKSVLAAKLIQIYQKKEELVASHFCKFNNSNYSNPQKLIQSLASHICDSVEGFREKLLEQLKRPNDVNNLQDAFQVYLKKPLQDLPQMKPMLIVIDGLDECKMDGKTDLLEVLAEEFSKLPTWLKVFVTSRPELNVGGKINSLESIEILATDENNEKDIREYLTPQLSNPLHHKNISKLTENCKGSFLFAFHLLNHLRKLGNNITNTDVMNPLPKGIKTFHLRYFERLEEQLRKVSEQYDIYHLVMIVTVAFEPIPLSLFTDGLKFAPNLQEMKQIIGDVNENISTLLYVSDDSVTPYHESVVDWVIKEDHKYSVDIGEACEVLWKITENKFNDIKNFFNETNESNVRSFTGNTTMQYVLENGFQHLFGAANHTDLDVHFEWLVDVFLLHVMSRAGFFGECIENWNRFLLEVARKAWNNNGGSSMTAIQEKVSWNYEHFSKCGIQPIYVQDFFNEGPKEIFCDEEKRIAKNILDNHVHFWCEKLGYLNLEAAINHVTACAFSPDGLNLVSCAKAGRICIWNINSLQIVKEVSSNCKNAIRCFWPEDEEIMIYHYAKDAEDAEDDLMLSRYTAQLAKKSHKKLAKKSDTPLAFSAQAFIFKSADSSIKVTRFTGTNQTTTCLPDLGCMHKVAVTRDGSSFLAADKDHFEIWNISGTTSTEYKLARSKKFELSKAKHKDCDCITEVLSCTISGNQKHGIISYLCSQSEEPNILVIEMDTETPGRGDDIMLPYPTHEKLHFELIEGNNHDIVSSGDDHESDEDDDDDDEDDDDSDEFYFVQSYKRITVYSNKCYGPLTHFNHNGDPYYYKESPICRSGTTIVLPQKSGGICMVKLHLPKTNEQNLNSRLHEFKWRS